MDKGAVGGQHTKRGYSVAHHAKVHGVAESQATMVCPPLFQPLWKVVSAGLQMKSAKSTRDL